MLQMLGLALLLHRDGVVGHPEIAAHRGEQVLPAVGEGPVEGECDHARQSEHDGHRGEQQQAPAYLGSHAAGQQGQFHRYAIRLQHFIRWPTP